MLLVPSLINTPKTTSHILKVEYEFKVSLTYCFVVNISHKSTYSSNENVTVE